MRIKLLGAIVALSLIVAPSASATTQYIIDEDSVKPGQTVIGSVPHLDKLVVRSIKPPAGDYIIDEPVSVMAPNDPQYSNQFGPSFSKFDWVWPFNLGSDVVIAVIDTGVTDANGDLSGRLLPGYDFVSEDEDASDDHGHGTRVANIAAAGMDNNIGIAGAAPAASILPVKVLDHTGNGFTSDVLNGIYYAVDNGADVINLSLGNTNPATIPYYEEALDYASLHNVTTVCAAGNDGASYPVAIPAAVESCIAVGGHDSSGGRYNGTHSGPELDIMAPGVAVSSCNHMSSCNSASGTSYAAPHVAAAAALLIKDGTHPNNVQTRLQQSAVDAGDPGFDNLWGYGILDIAAALQIPDPSLPCPTGQTRLPSGQCQDDSAVGTVVNATVLLSGGVALEGVALQNYRTISIQTTKKTHKYYRPDTSSAVANPPGITISWTHNNITIDGDSALAGHLIRSVSARGFSGEAEPFSEKLPTIIPLMGEPSFTAGDDSLTITGGGYYANIGAVGVLTSDDDWFIYYSPTFYGSNPYGTINVGNTQATITDSRLDGKIILSTTVYGYDGTWLNSWSTPVFIP